MADENILPRDQNHVVCAGFESASTAGLVLPGQIDEITGRIYVDMAGGSGTVTDVSVVSANGFAGTVADSTTTPAITLSTTINAPVLAGNGTALIAATTTGSGSTVVLATAPTFATSITTPAVLATANDSGAIGASGTAFSDLYLASGAVINFNAGNVGITHNNAGTFILVNPGDLRVTSANVGTNADSVPTLSSTSTLTNKTLTSPVLTTPSLGVATATSINGLTITATTGTLTMTNAKTLAVTNTLTLSGTDSTVMTFPTTSATIARTDAAQTFTGLQTYTNGVNYTNNAIAASGNAATVPITARIHTVTNNSAATLTITLTTASAVDGQLQLIRILDSSAAAQTIVWVNTENSTVTAPTTSNGSTTLPLTVGFQYNAATSKWRCIASA